MYNQPVKCPACNERNKPVAWMKKTSTIRVDPKQEGSPLYPPKTQRLMACPRCEYKGFIEEPLGTLPVTEYRETRAGSWRRLAGVPPKSDMQEVPVPARYLVENAVEPEDMEFFLNARSAQGYRIVKIIETVKMHDFETETGGRAEKEDVPHSSVEMFTLVFEYEDFGSDG